MSGIDDRAALVGYTAGQGVATVTLDSPHNRNALSTRLIEELNSSLEAASKDPDVHVVVLTHAGNTFCAGADLSETVEGEGAAEATVRRGHELVSTLRQILELQKPVIGRIDGHVRAGGFGLVAACDIAIAGSNTTFALTEARIGVAPAVISLTVLPRLTSRAANRYFLTGERFGAEEAEACGLITAAAPDVDQAVDAVVADILKGSPQGLAESKRLVTAPILAGFYSADDLAELSAELFLSEEAAEGMTAFLEKRPPRWIR